MKIKSLALTALATACLALPATAAGPEPMRLAQAETAPGPLIQEPMGGQFGGTTLGSELDGRPGDPAAGIGQPGQADQSTEAQDADDDDASRAGALSGLMFLIMAAGIGGGILLMRANRADTATGTHEYL